MAVELSTSESTLLRWKKHCLIDLDCKPGVKSFEVDELVRASRIIRELKDDLQSLRLQVLCSTGRNRFAQREVSGCQSTKRPGLL